MLRSVAIIAAAIGIVNPSVPVAARASYAKTIQATAKTYSIDPFTLVAIAWHESGFRPHAVSPDGEDYGLLQIRARYSKGCRGVPQDSKSCKAAKANLLNGHVNIRRAGSVIDQWRKLCRKQTKRPALFHRWLAGYAGLSHPRQGIWCGQKKVRGKWRDLRRHRGVQSIIKCRRSLIRKQACHRVRRSSRRR